MFFSLFHMSLGGGYVCQFMSHQDVVCQMNLTDHVGAIMMAQNVRPYIEH
jgi:hypothetical protein